jgi:hypothetical protein
MEVREGKKERKSGRVGGKERHSADFLAIPAGDLLSRPILAPLTVHPSNKGVSRTHHRTHDQFPPPPPTSLTVLEISSSPKRSFCDILTWFCQQDF